MNVLYFISIFVVSRGFEIKSVSRITSVRNNHVASATTDDNISTLKMDNAFVLDKAKEYRRQGIYTKALSLLQSIVHDISDHNNLATLAEVYFQMGCNYNDLGCISHSIDAFQKVMEIEIHLPSFNPDQISAASISKANVLLDGFGTREESYNVFKNVRHPGPCSLLSAMTADSLGLHDDSRQYYQQALVHSPFDTDAMVGMLCHYESFGCNDDKEMKIKEKLKVKIPHDALSSLNYVLEQKHSKLEYRHFFTHDMIHLALQNVSITNGLVMEFGVYFGKTLRMIASHFYNVDPSIEVHGFDTFDGLPEDWRGTKAGSYSTEGLIPDVGTNVKYHVGLFSDCLTTFLSDLRNNEIEQGDRVKPVSFMNIDCDLYSSTMDVLVPLAKEGRIVSGTVIVFDEYIMNPKWHDDEFKAFQQVANEYKWKYEYIAISLATGQAVIKIIK